MLFEKFNLLGQEVVLPVLCDENNTPIIDKNKKYSKKGYIPNINPVLKIINKTTTKTIVNNKQINNTLSIAEKKGQKLKLNISEWETFRLKDILIITTLPSLNINKAISGEYPYITRSAINNGLSGYFGNKDKLIKGNCITIGREGRYAFYQPDDFIPGVGICSLTNKYMNKYIGFFLVAVLNQSVYKYSYGRARNFSKLKEETIKLPIKRNLDNSPYIDKEKKYSIEGYIPDWSFMEEYIKSFNYELPKTKNSTIPNIKLDTVKWKEFEVSNIFLVKKLASLNINKTIPGKYPYITRTAFNNGLAGYFGNKDKVNTGNCITIGGEGKYAFYQSDNFIAGVNICALTNKYMNKYIGFFLVAVLNQSVYKYSYGRARNFSKLKEETIKLPIKRNLDNSPYIDEKREYSEEGYVPDWEFMENYIKSFPYGDVI